MDLIPTFFASAGIELPWEMHGYDLTPILMDPESETRERPLLTEHTGKYYGSATDTIPSDPAKLKETSGVPWYASIHDGRYKYIRTFVEGEVEELYDLETDPEELNNLSGTSEQRERLVRMRAETVAELERTGAGFVTHLPEVGEITAP